MAYGDAVRAAGAHVGQNLPPQAPPGQMPPGQPPPGYFPPGYNPYCGITQPVCQTNPCAQRRLIGGSADHVPSGGGGVVTIQSQIPFVARCWGVNSSAAGLIRFTGIINGVCNLILGGDVLGEAALSNSTCGNVVDGYPLLPGQTMTFNFTNFSGGGVCVDIWVGGELLCA